MDKLFLIDGHALVFKMYYAFLRKPMVNSKGADMSVLYGFTKYLLELLEREEPTHLAVAFDPPGGTFRNQLYPEYKGTRPPTPQLIIDALGPLTEILGAMNIPVLMMPGFEADDVIGSVALRRAREGMDVYMVTPDKDFGQLVGSHVFQYKPGKAGDKAEIVDKEALCAKWGILDPIQIIDLLTLCGDTADNVPGVKGIGEVGAGKLVSRYGSVENIYAHLEELPPRQQEMFREAEGHIALSKELVTIKTDIDVPVSTEELRRATSWKPEIADLFELYEFTSLKRYIAHIAASPKAEKAAAPPLREVSPSEVTALARKAGECALVAAASAQGGIFAVAGRLTVAVPDTGEGFATAASDDVAIFRSLLEDPAIDKYGADLKRTAHLLDAAGIALNGKWYDIPLMHYLTDPEKSHDTGILVKSRLGYDLEEEDAGAETGSLFDEPAPETNLSSGKEAAALLQLGGLLLKDLPDAQRLYDTMEEPLSKVLARMEHAGVKVDLGQIRHYADGLREELGEREDRIREEAGNPALNISSPKQVGDLLFDQLKLDPKAKKNARGQYTTDEATLLAVADRHPLVNEILEFRAVKKLLSTYIEPFPSYVSPVDGRVHTTFNQALTATGRLSSSNPNLQNIPIRTDRGKEIRKAFIPATPEGIILSADYSQIELRILAHLSQDAHLVAAFRDGVDIHAATAAKIFGIPHQEVTREQRGIAKTANFGILYGISAFGLAQRLHMPRKEAAKLIEDYFASFPSIRSFIDESVSFARDNGYVETMFGRRRYLPDILSQNATVRALAERNAVNAPIQGTSADIIKLAMIRIDERLRKEGFKSRMVLQIHDELLFDALPQEEAALRKMVVEVMENVIPLSVPLTVECSGGKNWLEAH